MKAAILILAAGRSRRMGKPKQLLKVGAKTLLQRAIETALGASAGAVYCVIGAQATAIREHIRGYPIHILEIQNPKQTWRKIFKWMFLARE